jgi:hypothetical protein
LNCLNKIFEIKLQENKIIFRHQILVVQLFEYIELVVASDLIGIKLHIVVQNSINQFKSYIEIYFINILTPIVTSGDCIVGDN